MKGPYAPAYSIGGGGRLSLSLDLVPGPASYNTDSDTKRSAPRPVIGKSQRYGHSTSRTGPGPGQYDTPSRIGQGRKALLFARNLPEMDRSRSPGPADYSPSDLTANCSYSVGRSKRHRTLSQHDVGPGPGSYNPKPISKASPRATSKKDFSLSQPEAPGPGNYEPTAVDKSQAFSFTKTSKAGQSFNDPPGPGTYNLETKPSATGVSITPRRPLTAGVLVNPGPGTYNQDRTDLKPAFSIGRSRRFFEEKEATGPAPADYTPTVVLRQAPCFSIGKSGRRLSDPREPIPGPASYKPFVTFFSPRYTIRSRGKQRPMTSQPGPGSYTPRAVSKRAPVTIMGSSSRDTELDSQVPAPNQYSITVGAVTPRYTFTRSRRLDGSGENRPGPGQYDFRNTVAALPSYALASKD